MYTIDDQQVEGAVSPETMPDLSSDCILALLLATSVRKAAIYRQSDGDGRRHPVLCCYLGGQRFMHLTRLNERERNLLESVVNRQRQLAADMKEVDQYIYDLRQERRRVWKIVKLLAKRAGFNFHGRKLRKTNIKRKVDDEHSD